jgi:hypothetical protein
VANAASHDFLQLRCRWAGFHDNAGESRRSRHRVSEISKTTFAPAR